MDKLLYPTSNNDIDKRFECYFDKKFFGNSLWGKCYFDPNIIINFISGVALVVIIHPIVALNLTGALYSHAVGFQKVAQFRSTRRARRLS